MGGYESSSDSDDDDYVETAADAQNFGTAIGATVVAKSKSQVAPDPIHPTKSTHTHHYSVNLYYFDSFLSL